MDPSPAHKLLGRRTRRDSGRLSPTPSSRRSSQSTLQSARTRQESIPLPTTGPEPSTSFSSGGSISEWRKEEIRALPQKLLGQCLLIMQARERQAPTIRDQPLIGTPPAEIGSTATTTQGSAVRGMFGSDINASCFAERERARQMEILMAMWSRGGNSG